MLFTCVGGGRTSIAAWQSSDEGPADVAELFHQDVSYFLSQKEPTFSMLFRSEEINEYGKEDLLKFLYPFHMLCLVVASMKSTIGTVILQCLDLENRDASI